MSLIRGIEKMIWLMSRTMQLEFGTKCWYIQISFFYAAVRWFVPEVCLKYIQVFLSLWRLKKGRKWSDWLISKWGTLCVSDQDTATQAIYISLPVYPTLNHHFELVCHSSITISSWLLTFNHHLMLDGPTHPSQVWIFIREPIPKPSDRFPSQGLDFKWVLATWGQHHHWNWLAVQCTMYTTFKKGFVLLSCRVHLHLDHIVNFFSIMHW